MLGAQSVGRVAGSSVGRAWQNSPLPQSGRGRRPGTGGTVASLWVRGDPAEGFREEGDGLPAEGSEAGGWRKPRGCGLGSRR